MDVLIPVPAGHLIDQISILRIKKARVADPKKRANVCRELDTLTRIRATLPGLSVPAVRQLESELGEINQMLWGVEDELRVLESRQDFGNRFIAAARSVYLSNDRRFAVKREIDRLAGASFCEEKSFSTSS
jgi:hypothetical protein